MTSKASPRQLIAKPLRVARAYEELASTIRDRIVAGELEPGDRLPSEAALARQAEVSRSTVREALRTLQEAGLIERTSPKIMVVCRGGQDRAHGEMRRALRHSNVTFRHLLEALLVVEPQLTRLATISAEPAQLEELALNLDAQAEALDDFDEWNRLDQEFHLAIAEMSANPALALARAPMTQTLMPVLERFMLSPKLTARALSLHRRILEEMDARDPDAAAMMMRKHLNDFGRGWELAGLNLDQQVGQQGDSTPSVFNGGGHGESEPRT